MIQRAQKLLRVSLYFACSILIMSACVPAKKLMYYQHGDEVYHRNRIPKDTVLRTHALKIKEYRIQPLDQLSVNFETLNDENDLFDFLSRISPQTRASGNPQSTVAATGLIVDRYGEIEYPVLGKIKVGGLTVFEAQDTIKNIASKYISDVTVRVRMLNFRFTVLGEVNTEKVVTSTNTRLTLSEAIGLAGGFGELADKSNIKVIRQRDDNADVYYINLLEENFLESEHYYIQQNDILVVPPLKQRTFRRYFLGNLAIVTTSISFVLFLLTLNNRL